MLAWLVHLSGVTVSMRVMSAGDGYRYLLRSVAAGDADRALSSPLTRYYMEAGTPPGRWLGGGVPDLGDGQLAVGAGVTEPQLQALIGHGRDPVTGEPLGRPYRVFAPVADRIAARIEGLDESLEVQARNAAAARIKREERERGTRRAVAGFDFTFSIPKSASVLWAVADAATQVVIVEAHHAAVAEVVAILEREVAGTRICADGGSGGVAQMPVTGVIATAFDHFDSRAGDPHLHTHVVIANKARTLSDGQWRALDGRPLHAAVVALSELHEAVFADRLTRTLGVRWEARERGRDRNVAWAIEGVPDRLLERFSSRSQQIEAATDELIEAYMTNHGRRPRPAAIIALRAQATLTTRPTKQVHSLADLTAGWRTAATTVLGTDATSWARAVLATSTPQPVLRAETVSGEQVAGWGRTALEAVEEKRSTWRRWNLIAEAARQTMGHRFATAADRERVLERIAEAAEGEAVRLTPPELAVSPPEFTRLDGSSRFRPHHAQVYTSRSLLAAEDRLLTLSHDRVAPRLTDGALGRLTHRYTFPGHQLGHTISAEQLTAIAAIGESGRTIDLLVGPAGTGKTTTMRALRHSWEHEHGPDSVVGLAPSAAAAEVLARDLGIGTENTAKWLHDHHHGVTDFRPGQLVILDEASLAGTRSLARIAEHAASRGAKLLLVGDHAQLQAIDAGGAFAMLVADRDDAPALADVHRFRSEWEKTASLGLRRGDSAVLETYGNHGRITGGVMATILETAYQAWRADLAAGRRSVLIADTVETVRELNDRARSERIFAGSVHGSGIGLHDGTAAGAGDLVVTRRNHRGLHVGRGWVRNGDRWTVRTVHPDGALTVRRLGSRFGGTVILPAAYVAEQVELGYAITTHRAQGITVDTAHAVITAASSRESLYVAMTRGRHANTVYVATDHPSALHSIEPPDEGATTARAVLGRVLAHVGTAQSAHAALRSEQDAWGSFRQIAAEYDTLATVAQNDRWATLIRSSGLDSDQADAVLASAAYGPLCTALRRAEAGHHNPDSLLPRLIAARELTDAADIAAVLHARVMELAPRPTGSGRRPRLIAGLIPEARGPMSPEMRQALHERKALLEQRATALAVSALHTRQAWTVRLGARPHDRLQAVAWQRSLRTIAAYRDRYSITDDAPLGGRVETDAQRRDAHLAAAALSAAQRCARTSGSDLVVPAPRTAHYERALER